MFNPLTRDDMRKIVELQIDNIKKVLAGNGIQITVTAYAMDYLVNSGYDPQYGARPVKRLLQREITNELSKEILAGKIDKDHRVEIDYFGEGLIFNNKR